MHAKKGQRLEGPTPRQLDVLRLAAEGKSNKVIASELGISPWTVKETLAGVYQRLRVGSRTEAVVMAIGKGWLT